MAKIEFVKSETFRCFNCEKTFGAEEMKFKRVSNNFNVIGGAAPGSEVQACPHCGAVAFLGFCTA